MLRPIPRRILSDNMILKICIGKDRWQSYQYTDYSVRRVHLQPTNEVRKSEENTEVVLRSILFADKRYSCPNLDLDALQSQSLKNGAPMRVICRGQEYQVITVDSVPDDQGRLHHWELGLV